MESIGEVRRVHIIYFLSRMGRTEHPHLVRVHHHNRNGVYLRDVKRWLADLRGKEMPESFAWSYKRRYKTGYVWQDLLDEDLITPISDNEYVLKGSQISSSAPFGCENNSMQQAAILVDIDQHQHSELLEQVKHPHHDPKMLISTENIHQEIPHVLSPNASTLTSKHVDEEKLHVKKTLDNSSSNLRLLNSNNNVVKGGSTSSSSPSSSSSSNRNRSHSSGASHMLRNLITCGAVETKDSVTVMNFNRTSSSAPAPAPAHNNNNNLSEICKGDKLGGSARIFGTSWNHQQHHSATRKSFDGVKDSKNKKEFPVCAAHKPVAGPNCSQCGKLFKPEKMHKHMKSCSGMKALAKSAATSAADRSTNISNNNEPPSSTYLLAH